MEEAKSGFREHVSPTSSPQNAGPPRQKIRAGRHCGRFWWAYIIALIIIVLVVVLPIIFVGFPHFAQSAVNDSTINITSMALLNPSPNSFDLTMTSVLGSGSSFHPQLDAFNASLYLPETSSPFLHLTIPAVKAENGAKTTLQRHVTLGDSDSFQAYTSAVLANETVSIILKGRTGLKEGSLPKTTVNYDKTITMAGFDGLNNFSISSIQILKSAQPDGTNLLANVSIPNPTVQTIAMGNLSMSLSVPATSGNTPVGTASISNVTLVPGPNSLPLRAVTNQTLILGLVEANATYLLNGLPVTVTTNNATVDGQDIPWLSNALRQAPLNVKLNLAQATQT